MSAIYDGQGNVFEIDKAIETDATLTKSDIPADAKATGDVTKALEGAIGEVPCVYITGDLPTDKAQGEYPVMLTFKSKTQEFTSYATLKVQGDSSTRYAKKNYTIKLYSDSARTKKDKRTFKHWSKYNKFVIKANWIDITHSRNVVGARIWSDMVKSRSDYDDLPTDMLESDNIGDIDGFPVRVFANGLYYGRYSWNITKDNMLNMDDANPNHAMVQGQDNTDNGCKFRSTSLTYWSDELTDDITHVATRWQEVLTFVSTASDADFASDLGDYFSIPSLIDWYLFGLAFFAYDSYGKNQSYLTYDGQYFICSAYDMDCILNVFWTGYMPFQATEAWYPYYHIVYTNTITGAHSGFEEGNYLFERLAGQFDTEIKARWAELRAHGGALSFENVDKRFEDWCSLVSTELMAEDYASTTAGGAFTAMANIASGNIATNNIKQIRSFAHDRLVYVDGLMEE